MGASKKEFETELNDINFVAAMAAFDYLCERVEARLSRLAFNIQRMVRMEAHLAGLG